ncbi:MULTISPECIES: DUF1876 domain-containing protein [unclassified Streptomyces]|uniref:DUF1876 domain-containing protein n=1 Tax=unclassified Streptomyces TaxID=2593676 RepID=UPI002E1956F7|nr:MULTISPECIES: DUF1876 domain-containing protein [unclassified Streptomyces]
MAAKEWTVRIHITEEGDETRARADLVAPGSSMTVTGRGSARRNPIDRPVPEIGDELAVGRALEDLALRLHDVAVDDIVELTGPVGPVHRTAPGWESP